jgi:Ca-activated chloride channel family protein
MGIYISLDHFSRLARKDAEVRKSAIVVLSDGEDTTSLLGEEDVIQRARRVGVPIYFISLLSESEARQLDASRERRRSEPHDFILRSLSRETGGRAFFPSRLEELNGVYDSVSRELSTQYTLAYTPSNGVTDGAFRRVLVRVPGRPDARPRTRAGYYAPGAKNALRYESR